MSKSKIISVALACWWGLMLSGCGQPEPAAPPTTLETSNVVQPMSPRVAQMWARSCALCHVDGTAFAPRVGQLAEWQPRLAQGREVLLQHTLEGFNEMPPLGYCMGCEREDFLAMIEFMTAGLGGVDEN